MQSARTLVLLAVTLGAVTAAVLMRSRSAPEDGGRVGARDAEQSSAAELQRVRQEVAEAKRATDSLRKLVGGIAREQGAVPEGPEAPTPAAASAEPAPSREEELTFIQSEFAAESGDPGWNPSRALQGQLSTVLPHGSALRSVDCRRSMCRVETSHRSLKDFNSFSNDFMMARLTSPVVSGAIAFDVREPTRDGEEVVAVAYLGKTSLPSLED